MRFVRWLRELRLAHQTARANRYRVEETLRKDLRAGRFDYFRPKDATKEER